MSRKVFTRNHMLFETRKIIVHNKWFAVNTYNTVKEPVTHSEQ